MILFASVGQLALSLPNFDLNSLKLGVLGGVLLPLVALVKALQAFGLNPKNLMNTMTEGIRRDKFTANPGARYQFAREFADVTQALGNRKMVIFVADRPYSASGAALSEAKIVALSAIYQVKADWVADDAIFDEIMHMKRIPQRLQKDFAHQFTIDKQDMDQKRLQEVANRLNIAIEQHRNDDRLGAEFPDTKDRQQFIDAWNGIRIKVNRPEKSKSNDELPDSVDR